MVHSVVKKTEFTEVMEKVFMFKNNLNTLSYEIDQTAYRVLNFEKELKRVRFH